MKPIPCPHAYENDGIHRSINVEITSDMSIGGEFTRCMECGAQGPVAYYNVWGENASDKALELWNRRGAFDVEEWKP